MTQLLADNRGQAAAPKTPDQVSRPHPERRTNVISSM